MSVPAGSRPHGEVLPAPSLKALRAMQTGGFSRRTLLRRALGAGVGLLVVEWLGGTLAFAWSAGSAAAPKVRVGTLDDLVAINPDLPIREGFPTYVPSARAFIVLVDPAIGGFQPGSRCDRERRGAQRPGVVAEMPAPRLPPEPVRRGLLVPLPMPSIPLRPAGDQGCR